MHSPNDSGANVAIHAVTVAEPAVVNVNTLADEDDVPAGASVSLREAIREAPSGAIVRFASSLSGGTIVLGGTQLPVDKDLVIDGSTLPGGITISGNNLSRVFEIPRATAPASPHAVVFDHLTITGGRTGAGANGVGGAGGRVAASPMRDPHRQQLQGQRELDRPGGPRPGRPAAGPAGMAVASSMDSKQPSLP